MSDGLAAPEQLLVRAQRLARLDDFGADVMPALQVFCSSFGEMPLSPAGRLTLEMRATQALVTRLRLVDVRSKQPALFEEPVADPIIIVGLPRAGTSYLQQLLASLPGRRYLRFWEAREPIADTDDQRVGYYEHALALKLSAMPELAVQHPMNAHGAEECMFLLDPSLRSPSFVMSDVPCPSYFNSWLEEPQGEAYLGYRQLLQYLQAQSPERRWILKSPAHFGMLAPLLQAIPSARLVHLHRDPLQVLPSMISLYETLSRGTLRAEGFDRHAHGLLGQGFLERIIARNTEQRRSLPAASCFDLLFSDLVQQPGESVRRLHEYFGLPWTDSDKQALTRELGRGTPAQVGRHHYRLENYGLEAAQVAQRFHDYRRRWGFAG